MKNCRLNLWLLILLFFLTPFAKSQNINDDSKLIMMNLSLDETMMTIHKTDYDIECIYNKKINEKFYTEIYIVSLKNKKIISQGFQITNKDTYSMLREIVLANGTLKGYETYSFGLNYLGFLDSNSYAVFNKDFYYAVEGITPELVTELKKVILLLYK